jgi:hypothetical protein
MDDGTAIFSVFFYCLIFGAVGALIGNRKGAAGSGFFLGVMLGPLGWIITAISKGNRIACPACRELVDPAATICPKCQTRLGAAAAVATNRAAPMSSITQLETGTASVPAPPRRKVISDPGQLHVSCDGNDWGKQPIEHVRGWLVAGNLTMADHYFDPEMQQWLTLDCHPDLADLQA